MGLYTYTYIIPIPQQTFHSLTTYSCTSHAMDGHYYVVSTTYDLCPSSWFVWMSGGSPRTHLNTYLQHVGYGSADAKSIDNAISVIRASRAQSAGFAVLAGYPIGTTEFLICGCLCRMVLPCRSALAVEGLLDDALRYVALSGSTP